jgi:GGDEF domain-containing protein
MSVSLGIGQKPRDGNDLTSLLSAADMNLYQSKTQQTEAAEESSEFDRFAEDTEAS